MNIFILFDEFNANREFVRELGEFNIEVTPIESVSFLDNEAQPLGFFLTSSTTIIADIIKTSPHIKNPILLLINESSFSESLIDEIKKVQAINGLLIYPVHKKILKIQLNFFQSMLVQQNIWEQKTSKLTANLRFYFSIFETVSNAILLFDNSGEFLQANQSFYEMLRVPSEEYYKSENLFFNYLADNLINPEPFGPKSEC